MKAYTLQFLKFTLADLTDNARQAEFALHLGKMSQEQGWEFVEMHPVGTGVVVVYASELPPTP